MTSSLLGHPIIVAVPLPHRYLSSHRIDFCVAGVALHGRLLVYGAFYTGHAEPPVLGDVLARRARKSIRYVVRQLDHLL